MWFIRAFASDVGKRVRDFRVALNTYELLRPGRVFALVARQGKAKGSALYTCAFFGGKSSALQ